MMADSGNYLVDLQEQMENDKLRQSQTFPCGCYKECTCDKDDEKEF